MRYYIHNTPGRLRVRIPALKNNQVNADYLVDLLKQMEGVESTTANPLTGSIVVNYNVNAIRPERILNELSQKGYVDPSRAVTNDQCVEDAICKAGGVVSKALLSLFLEKAFEGTGLSLLTALI